jgi:hypothetical protein
MKRIDGMPVGNGAARLRVNVTPNDIKIGKPMNPNACAIAVACVRQLKGVTAAKVHLGRVYLLQHGEWRRWYMPEYGRIEVIAFDRGGKFVPQEIDLMPPPIQVLERYRKAKPRRSSSRRPGPRRRRQKVHRVMDVRDDAHGNDPT